MSQPSNDLSRRQFGLRVGSACLLGLGGASLGALASAGCQASKPAGRAANTGSGTGTGESSSQPAMFQNPLFAGDYADPSIVRVGEDFYITHTSYRFAPGLVVWHSRDLVNWTPISAALPHTVGEVWAPEFVCHAGRYLIYFPLDGRLFVTHTNNPRGQWSEPIDLQVGGIDPGHVVGPDGTRYLHFSGGQAVQLAPDGLSVVGNIQKVYEGWPIPDDWATAGFWLESPKLIRRNGWYYLVSAQGGTDGPPTSHMAVVARSMHPLGPWENAPNNPLIHTYNASENWWSVGHGTLIDTPDGRWFFVYHGYRKNFHTLGRHTLLEPVTWDAEGWPTAPLGKDRGQPMPSPMGAVQAPMLALSDDFRRAKLKATWGVWDETDMSRFQTGGGRLTIAGKGHTLGDSSPVTAMARDPRYTLEATILDPENVKTQGGLGLFYNPDNHLFLSWNGETLRVVHNRKMLQKLDWKQPKLHARLIFNDNQVTLQASAVGAEGSAASSAANAWQPVLAGFDASVFNHNDLRGFLCARPALAASGEGQVGFERFVYTARS